MSPWIFSATTIASVLLAMAFFFLADQPLYFDAQTYARLAHFIARNGLLLYFHDTRPYGYPLFLAPAAAIVSYKSPLFRLLVFGLQLTLYIIACRFASKRLAPLVHLDRELVYGMLVLNPFLLIASGEVLSDQLAAVLVLVGVSLSLPRADCGPHADPGAARRLGTPFLAFLSLSGAVIVRPICAVVWLAAAAIWLARVLVRGDAAWSALAVGTVASMLMFAPQIRTNYLHYNKVTPLIARDLYREQASWGTRYLKWNTLAIPASRYNAIPYRNPLGGTFASLGEFARSRPLAFVATLFLHAFALTDQEFPFVFIRDASPWYRWPLSVLNYGFWFLALTGWIVWWRESGSQGTKFALLSLFGTALAYLAVHLPTAAESRFSLPLYLLNTPAACRGLIHLRDAVRLRARRTFLPVATAGLLYVLGSAVLSGWIGRQGPEMRRLASLPASALPPPKPTPVSKARIRKLVPPEIAAGVPFLVQPGGQSAIALIGEGFATEDTVLWNGEELDTAYGGPTLLTATVPGRLFQRPGIATIAVGPSQMMLPIVPPKVFGTPAAARR